MRKRFFRFHARNILSLVRPQFLIGSIFMFLIGAFAVADAEDIFRTGYIAALAAFMLVQISAHLVNEYSDWEGDRFARKSLFAGGSGEVATGRVEPSTALSLSIITLSIAVSLGIFVNAEVPGREQFLPLFIISVALACAYSIRPVRIMESGFGEAMIVVLLVWAVPLMTAYLFTGRSTDDLFPYLVILSMFCFAAMIGVEFPDKQSDIRSSKKNLTYRFGVRNMAKVQAAVLFAGYALTFAMVLLGIIGWINLLVLITAIWGWAAVTLMIMPRHYDYEWARSASNVTMIILAVSMALALTDIAVM